MSCSDTPLIADRGEGASSPKSLHTNPASSGCCSFSKISISDSRVTTTTTTNPIWANEDELVKRIAIAKVVGVLD